MAGSLNKVMLIGRLTRDPEMRYTPTGSPVTSFGLATNRYTSGEGGERKEMTDFHDIVVWNIGRRNLAEIVAQYMKKGAQVYIEGRLQTRSWDGQDGQKRYRTEVVANDVQFLDPRGGGEGGGGYQRGGDYGSGSEAPQGGGSAGDYPEPATRQAPPPPAPPRRESPAVQEVDPDDIPF